MMEPRIKWGIAAIIILIIIFTLTKRLALQESIVEKDAQLLQMHQQAQSYQKLKKRWDNKQSTKKLLDKLSKVQTPSEHFKKGKKSTVRYKNLSALLLNKLSHAILASDAHILSLSIKKEEKGTFLELEVQQ